MMRFIQIVGILLTFTAKAENKDSTFKTKGGDVITIKGRDTLVAFAGNWRVYPKKQEAVKKNAAKRTARDAMWDDVVIRRQKRAAIPQIHGSQIAPLKAPKMPKKTTKGK